MSGTDASPLAPENIDKQEPGTLYYLKVTRRHINDVLVLGPLVELTDVIRKMISYLRDLRSYAGLDMLSELVHSPGFNPKGLVFLHGPLPNGTFVRLDLFVDATRRSWPLYQQLENIRSDAL